MAALAPMAFPNQFVDVVITLWEGNRCLYDKNSIDFNNARAKDHAKREIISEFTALTGITLNTG